MWRILHDAGMKIVKYIQNNKAHHALYFNKFHHIYWLALNILWCLGTKTSTHQENITTINCDMNIKCIRFMTNEYL